MNPAAMPAAGQNKAAAESAPYRQWGAAAVALTAATLAVLKTLRLPNSWATTESLIDYSQGFVKRGLLGQLYRLLHLTGYAALQRVTLAQVVVLLLALAALAFRARVARCTGSALLPAAFLGSYAVSFLVHMVGYADLLNATLAIALLLVRDPLRRALLAVPLCAAAVLLHENFLLTQFPVVLFSFAADGLLLRRRRLAWAAGALLGLAAVAFTALVATRGLLSPAAVARLHQSALQHRDLEINPDVFPVFSRSFAQNRAGTVYMESQPKWRREMAVSVADLLPVTVLMLAAGWRSVRQQVPRGAAGHWLLALATAASLCPLGMHLLGFDAVRWNTLCTLNTWLVLCVLAMRLAPVRTAPARWQSNATLVVLLVGMASGYGLMDDEDINPYPFWPTLLHTLADYRAGVAQQVELSR